MATIIFSYEEHNDESSLSIRTHSGSCESSQALFTILFDPPLDGAGSDSVGTCYLRLGDAIFQGWSNDGKAAVCLCSLVL